MLFEPSEYGEMLDQMFDLQVREMGVEIAERFYLFFSFVVRYVGVL